MRLFLTTLGAVLALACPASAGAAAVHAHDAGALARALSDAPAGTTVIVHEGSYPRVAFDRSGLALRANPGDKVTLGGVTVNRATGVGVRGFRITGGIEIHSGSSRVAIVGNDITREGIWVGQARRLTIARNYIHDLQPETQAIGMDGSAGGRGQGGVRRVRITGNRILRLTGDGIAVFWAASRVLIARNEIGHVRFLGEPHMHADAMQLGGLDDDQRRVVIRRNHIHDNFYGLIVKQGGSGTITGLRLERNEFVRTEARHLDLDQGVRGARVVGNTFRDSAWGVFVGSGATAVFRGNLIDEFELGPGGRVSGQRLP